MVNKKGSSCYPGESYFRVEPYFRFKCNLQIIFKNTKRILKKVKIPDRYGKCCEK